MDSLITKFKNDYPRTTAMANEIAEMNLPSSISLWITISVSVLMEKIKNGETNKYLKDNRTITSETIDLFGECYLQNIKYTATLIFERTGNYEMIKTLEKFKPNVFIEKLIKEYC